MNDENFYRKAVEQAVAPPEFLMIASAPIAPPGASGYRERWG